MSGAFLKILEKGDVDILRAMLIEHPEYLTLNITWNDQQSSGFPLNYAAYAGHAKVIQLIVEEMGADVNEQENHRSGWTPLHHAAANNAESSVKTLLVLGADPSLKNHKGETPLDLCSNSGIASILAAAVAKRTPLPLRKERKENTWELASPCEVVSTRRTPDNVYRLTEIFNFDTRRVTSIALELNSNAVAQTIMFFDDISDKKMLLDAHAKLIKLGGQADASSVYRRKLENKSKLPGMK